MRIEISNLKLELIIGVLPKERQSLQRLIVDLEADYHYAKGEFLDYAQICSKIRHILVEGKFALLEDALLALKEEILQSYPNIERLFLRLSKPDILPDCQVAVSKEWKNRAQTPITQKKEV